MINPVEHKWPVRVDERDCESLNTSVVLAKITPKVFRTSIGLFIEGREVFLYDIIYHRTKGPMIVLGNVDSKPHCIYTTSHPVHGNQRGYIERVMDYSWSENTAELGNDNTLP